LLTADNRSLTILLGSDNKVSWVYGQVARPIEVMVLLLLVTVDGIRKVLMEKKAYVPRVQAVKT
jgi:phage-related holin